MVFMPARKPAIEPVNVIAHIDRCRMCREFMNTTGAFSAS